MDRRYGGESFPTGSSSSRHGRVMALIIVIMFVLIPVIFMYIIGGSISIASEPCSIDTTESVVLESPGSLKLLTLDSCVSVQVYVAPSSGGYMVVATVIPLEDVDRFYLEVSLASSEGLAGSHFNRTHAVIVREDVLAGTTLRVAFDGALPSDFPLSVVFRVKAG